MVIDDYFNDAMNAQSECKLVFVLVYIFVIYHFMMRLDPVSLLKNLVMKKSGKRKCGSDFIEIGGKVFNKLMREKST